MSLCIFNGFGGLGVPCWPLVPKFAGSNPAEAVRILGRKNTQHAFLGEVKPSVPYRIFAACKRSLNLCGSRNLGKITGQLSRPQIHLSLLGSLTSLRTYRHLAAKVGSSKGGGKAMANYTQELAQDAVCQSHTGHMTGLWFLPTQPLRLNANEWMNEWMNALFKFVFHTNRIFKQIKLTFSEWIANGAIGLMITIDPPAYVWIRLLP